MIIYVKLLTGEVYSLECEFTDTLAHLKAKLYSIEGTPPRDQRLIYAGKQLEDLYNGFSENKTLAELGCPDQSTLHLVERLRGGGSGVIERPRTSQKGYIHYADAFKYGWREEHAKVLLQLLLELCQDGTISEGNVTDEAWLRIQNGLKSSTNYSFQIDFLEERLCDYKQLYLLLAETSSSIFHWDRENKTINIKRADWREDHPELLLLCAAYIPYFDTLEKVCLLLTTKRSSEQQGSETSTNTNNEKLVDQDIPRFSNIRTIFRKYRQRLKQLFTCMI